MGTTAENVFGSDFLSHNTKMVINVTWVPFVKVETREQSKQLKRTHLPNKPKGVNKRLPARKLVATVSWDRKGALIAEFV
jgi:hypothetical protein